MQRFEIDPYQDFDHLDQEMQFYVEQSQNAIQICTEIEKDVNEQLN